MRDAAGRKRMGAMDALETKGKGALAAGVVAGAVLAVSLIWLVLHGRPAPPPEPEATQPPAAAMQSAAPVAAEPRKEAAAAVPLAAAPTGGPCAFEPIVPQGRASDGQFMIDAALATSGDARPSAFIAVAREAASEGRPRDAEVAYIVACRLEARASSSPSVPVANILTLLGQHYVSAAADTSTDESRRELLARGRELLDASVQGYNAVLGAGAARTQQASQQLAAISRGEAAKVEPPALVPAERLPTEHEAEGHCATGRSACDAQLAQLDNDLRRLRAQAEGVSRDRAGLRRRAAQAEARREACQDRDCLVRWYAQRRNELLREF
jgi:hypothetical protein